MKGRAVRGLLVAGLLCRAAQLSAEPSPAALRRAIEPIVSRADFAAVSWGIEVRELKSGRVLYARDAAKSFHPASTLKLVTTAVALDVLGPEAVVRTTVETAGRLDGMGRLLGDVFLVGRGDANLSARFSPGRPTAAFEELAEALLAAGVRRIEGRLVGHEGAFSGDRRGHDWTWEDLVWGYGAEVSSLSFNDNVAEVSLRPGERVGDPVLLEQAPIPSAAAVECTVSTAPAGSPPEIRLEKPVRGPVQLTGRLPIGGEWSGRVAVEDPARYAVRVFAAVLEARGIRVTGGIETSRVPLPVTRVLAAHAGPALSEVIREVNKDSLNLNAEALLRLVGLRVKGEGSVEKGREAALETLARLGVNTRGFLIADGCGLARTNLLTPTGLTTLLVAMDRHPFAGAFRASLPVAGVDGTLERRLRGTAAEGRILAKTGTLSLANGLAGYATTARGERLAFAILVNNHIGGAREIQAAIDEVVKALVAR